MADSFLEPQLQALADRFERFARECRDLSCPLYERLTVAIAADPEVLALGTEARKHQPLPNLFFGAVHFLLLSGIDHPVRAFYPSVSKPIAGTNEDPYPYFRSFCLEHRDELTELIASRIVQTNVVGRCAYLMPVFGHIAHRAGDLPLSLVEVGSSAGLNLLWDRYGYNYGEDGTFGDPDSPVQIVGELRGAHRPSIQRLFSHVASRVGIDLNPINLNDPTEALWLRALVWPERQDEADRLAAAMEVARQHPVLQVAGDALELLPKLFRGVLKDTALCVYNSHTLNQLSPEARETLTSLIAEYGRRSNVYWVSVEGFAGPAEIRLTSFEDGQESETLLGYCDSHGRWLEWLGRS